MTYVMGHYGDRYVVLRIDPSGPSYTVVAVCTAEDQASTIAALMTANYS